MKYLSDKVLSSSFIEYRLIQSNENSQTYYDCIIQNVSDDKTYSLIFSLKTLSKESLRRLGFFHILLTFNPID